MLDLRAILTKHRIEWRDRGANTSKGNINISCPMCKTDTSFHMALSEEGKGWYCWRNPEHNGRHLGYIFKLLGIPTDNLPKATKSPEWIAPRVLPIIERHTSFRPAEESVECLSYLERRGFQLPKHVARDFKLMYATRGAWACRLIIPLTEGWTGRSMRPHIEPRYKSEFNERSFFLIPGHSKETVIMEGPLDGLRLAAVTSEFTIIAMCGMKLSDAILNYLRELRPSKIHYVPDGGVPVQTYCRAMNVLQASVPRAIVRPRFVADHAKDLCELPEARVLEWIHG